NTPIQTTPRIGPRNSVATSTIGDNILALFLLFLPLIASLPQADSLAPSNRTGPPAAVLRGPQLLALDYDRSFPESCSLLTPRDAVRGPTSRRPARVPQCRARRRRRRPRSVSRR